MENKVIQLYFGEENRTVFPKQVIPIIAYATATGMNPTLIINIIHKSKKKKKKIYKLF